MPGPSLPGTEGPLWSSAASALVRIRGDQLKFRGDQASERGTIPEGRTNQSSETGPEASWASRRTWAAGSHSPPNSASAVESMLVRTVTFEDQRGRAVQFQAVFCAALGGAHHGGDPPLQWMVSIWTSNRVVAETALATVLGMS